VVCAKHKEKPKCLFAASAANMDLKVIQASVKGQIQVISMGKLFNMLATDNNLQWEKQAKHNCHEVFVLKDSDETSVSLKGEPIAFNINTFFEK